MSGTNALGNEVSVDAQAYTQPDETVLDEDGFEVVDGTPAFRPTVALERQAKVDANHPDGIAQDADGRLYGVTLAQEERIQAREAELEHISAQAILGPQDGRAKRTRTVVQAARREHRQQRTLKREGTRGDPRETLSQMELADVNREADRIVQELRGSPSRAAVSQLLARRLSRGLDLVEAVFATLEGLKTAPGTVCPIGDLPKVSRTEVSVAGEIVKLWSPSDSAISQVGLIADESGKTKFTIWEKSDQPGVREGDRVTFRHAKLNWYQGRCSIALTYDSMILFPERDDRWWE
jgi:hypothetical protein